MTGREGSAHHPHGTIGFRIGTDCPTSEEQVIRHGGAQGPQWDIGQALASQIDEAHPARSLLHLHWQVDTTYSARPAAAGRRRVSSEERREGNEGVSQGR